MDVANMYEFYMKFFRGDYSHFAKYKENCLHTCCVNCIQTLSYLRNFKLRSFRLKAIGIPNFSLRERRGRETNVVEEHCWAMTKAALSIMLRPMGFKYIAVCVSTVPHVLHVRG